MPSPNACMFRNFIVPKKMCHVGKLQRVGTNTFCPPSQSPGLAGEFGSAGISVDFPRSGPQTDLVPTTENGNEALPTSAHACVFTVLYCSAFSWCSRHTCTNLMATATLCHCLDCVHHLCCNASVKTNHFRIPVAQSGHPQGVSCDSKLVNLF